MDAILEAKCKAWFDSHKQIEQEYTNMIHRYFDVYFRHVDFQDQKETLALSRKGLLKIIAELEYVCGVTLPIFVIEGMLQRCEDDLLRSFEEEPE